MKENDLLSKIDSARGAELFAELYGAREVDNARRRYKALIAGMHSEDFGAGGDLRVFSAAVFARFFAEKRANTSNRRFAGGDD
jgi:hypothetical protein